MIEVPLRRPATSPGGKVQTPQKGELHTKESLYRHAVLDTKNRTSVSTTLYLILWLVVSGGGGLWQTWPEWVAIHAAGFLLIGGIRSCIHRQLPTLLEHSPLLANSLLCAVVVSNGLYWGCLSASSVVNAWGSDIWWAMLIIGFSLAAAGSAAMAMNMALRFGFPAAVLLPLIYCPISQPSSRNLLLLCLIALLFVYVILATTAIRRDYCDAILARLATEDKAQHLLHLSRTDSLTGVANRAAFDTRLAIEWAAAIKTGSALSLLIVDLDHFKAINDTHGHPFGDECLKAAARGLEESVRRQGDTVFRYGGEEFAILLAATEPEGVALVAQRCLEHTRALKMTQNGRLVTLTCSIGIAIKRPLEGGDPQQLIQEADAALYRAKHDGRDRAVWADRGVMP